MARRQATVSVRELEAYLGSGYKVLRDLGYDHIPTDHNPIWLALAEPGHTAAKVVLQQEPQRNGIQTGRADAGTCVD